MVRRPWAREAFTSGAPWRRGMSAIPLARPRSCAACFAFSNSEPKVAPFPNAGLGARKAGLAPIAIVVKSSFVSTPYPSVDMSQQKGEDSPPQFQVGSNIFGRLQAAHTLL